MDHVVGELKARAKMISTTEEIAQVGIAFSGAEGCGPCVLSGLPGLDGCHQYG